MADRGPEKRAEATWQSRSMDFVICLVCSSDLRMPLPGRLMRSAATNVPDVMVGKSPFYHMRARSGSDHVVFAQESVEG